MKEFQMDYWTWRKQPWCKVIENFRVLEAKNRFEAEEARKAQRLAELRNRNKK